MQAIISVAGLRDLVSTRNVWYQSSADTNLSPLFIENNEEKS